MGVDGESGSRVINRVAGAGVGIYTPPLLTNWSPPVGWEEIRRFYGWDPTLYLLPDGTVSERWRHDMMTQVVLPSPLSLSWNLNTFIQRVTVHKRIAPFLELSLGTIYRLGFWHYLDPFGGAYEFRRQRDSSSKLSLHALGGALDFDPLGNPRGKPAGECRMHGDVIRVFEDRGFTNGKDFPTPDTMHFQIGRGY